MTTANDEHRPVTIELTIDDLAGCIDTSASAAAFRTDMQADRFEVHDPTTEHEMGDDLIGDPTFDDGSLLWCHGYVDALLVAKVHRAIGHTAYLLWDLAPRDDGRTPLGHVVLSSRPQDPHPLLG